MLQSTWIYLVNDFIQLEDDNLIHIQAKKHYMYLKKKIK